MNSMYLCSTPRFWAGVGRLFDFGKTFDVYNEAPSGAQADSLGLMLDWQMVRQDLWDAVWEYDPEIRIAEEDRREIHMQLR